MDAADDDDFFVILRDELAQRAEDPTDEAEFRRFLAVVVRLFGVIEGDDQEM